MKAFIAIILFIVLRTINSNVETNMVLDIPLKEGSLSKISELSHDYSIDLSGGKVNILYTSREQYNSNNLFLI